MFSMNAGLEAFQERLRNLTLPEHHFADQLQRATQVHGEYAQRLADLVPNHANEMALAFPSGLPDYLSGEHSTLLDQIDQITLSRRQLLDSVGVLKDHSELIRHQFQQPLADLTQSGARALAAAFPRGIPNYVSDAQEMLAGHLERLTQATRGISVLNLQVSVLGLGRNAEQLRGLLEPFSKQFAEVALRSVRVDDAGRVMIDEEELDRDEVDTATKVLSRASPASVTFWRKCSRCCRSSRSLSRG